jgi:hypothetical protein
MTLDGCRRFGAIEFERVAFIAAATAEWNGQSKDMPCGGLYSAPEASMVNSTCTVSGDDILRVQVGNGAFIIGKNPYRFTGIDGVSGRAEAVIYFDQDQLPDGSMDNSTCWDAAISCVDNGAATAGALFMDTVSNTSPGAGFNLQIAGVEDGNTVSFNMGTAVNNITCAFGSITSTDGTDVWGNTHSSDGVFSIALNPGEVFGQLLQVSVVDVDGKLDLFDATVVAA